MKKLRDSGLKNRKKATKKPKGMVWEHKNYG